MQRKLKTGIGIAVLALCVPALTLAVPTKDELMQKSMPAGAAAKVTEQSKSADADRAMFMKLRSRKKALIQQRRALVRAHDLKGREANMKQLMQVNSELNKVGKGGAAK